MNISFLFSPNHSTVCAKTNDRNFTTSPLTLGYFEQRHMFVSNVSWVKYVFGPSSFSEI